MHHQQLLIGLSEPALVLAQAMVLASWWKALILFLPFVPWAWLVATVYDKHALRFHLGNTGWNLIHLSAGLGALVLGFGIPALAGLGGFVGFLVSLAIILVVLGADVVAYPMVANKDERVPEAHQVRLNLDSLKAARAKREEAREAGTVELQIRKPDKSRLGPPLKDTPEYAVRLKAEEVVIKGLDLRASQIDLLPAKDGVYATRYLVDGVVQAGETLPAQQAMAIIDLWKAGAGLEVEDRRRRQTGPVHITRDDNSTSCKVVTIGGQGGQRMSMMIEPAAAVRRTADKLGLLDQQMESLREIVQTPGGVVLLSAPADGGRTTMMYAMVKMHDAYTSNVQTLELEAEDALEGVRQNVFDPYAEGQEFSKHLRSILRRDPDVVGVAEVPDSDTALEMTRADLERTRVYASLRAGDALQAISAWARAVGDVEVAGDVLRGVVAGRLVRKLCENCKVAYQPTPEMLRKLGLPAEKVQQLFKKGGQVLIKNKPDVCPVCHGIGYAGQTGVFEVYPLGVDERTLIKQGNVQALRAALRSRRLPTIQQAALRKAVEGATSVEEVLRVTSEQKPPPSGGKRQPAPASA